ncbi:MAG: ROK family protein [Armatimonadetes bacterium]|nr:ROK family protein [Armatimonadota bacterium]
MSKRCTIGVDLGGTNVRAQAIFEDGTEAGPRAERGSNATGGVEAVANAIVAVIQEARAGCQAAPEAVGIAVPGHVDDDAGMVKWSPNFGSIENGVFQYWTDVAIREPIQRAVDLPIRLGNDANLAALGEYRFGSGKGSANCLVIFTIGTGIGGGVVLGPKSLLGSVSAPVVLVGGNMGGAELGHTTILAGGLASTSGAYGSIEAYCQRDSIVRRAAYRLVRGKKSVLQDMTGGNYDLLSPKMLSEAADQGDAVAQEVWAEVGFYLGLGIGNMINIFAPDVFAIGGQIAKAGKWLIEPAIASAENVAIPTLFRDVRIVQAELSDDAGVLGGAALALQSR